MKKFDYGKAWSDLYDCECPDPDELYEHTSEKGLKEFMGEFGLDARKYYKDDGKDSKPSTSSGFSDNTSSQDECFVTTACVSSFGRPDDCVELEMLRAFRDIYVSRQSQGKEDIDMYYRLAPSVVKAINERPDSAAIWKEVYSGMITPCLKWIRERRFREAYEHYKQYTLRLWDTYVI